MYIQYTYCAYAIIFPVDTSSDQTSNLQIDCPWILYTEGEMIKRKQLIAKNVFLLRPAWNDHGY